MLLDGHDPLLACNRIGMQSNWQPHYSGRCVREPAVNPSTQGNRVLFEPALPVPFITMKIDHFHTHTWPEQGHPHFRRKRESRAVNGWSPSGRGRPLGHWPDVICRIPYHCNPAKAGLQWPFDHLRVWKRVIFVAMTVLPAGKPSFYFQTRLLYPRAALPSCSLGVIGRLVPQSQLSLTGLGR